MNWTLFMPAFGLTPLRLAESPRVSHCTTPYNTSEKKGVVLGFLASWNCSRDRSARCVALIAHFKFITLHFAVTGWPIISQAWCILPLNNFGGRAQAVSRRTSALVDSERVPDTSAHKIPPLWLAFGLTAFFAGFALLPIVNTNPRLLWSFLGATAGLSLFLLFLVRQVVRRGRQLRYEIAARPVHYVQMVMHSSIYAYWGWYWREVYHEIPLIVAQIAFVYVLDMLVCWSRRDNWVLGFGPFPIVLSTNLFLWFKADWFFLQFLMIATGVLCKEFITWSERWTARVHFQSVSHRVISVFYRPDRYPKYADFLGR